MKAVDERRRRQIPDSGFGLLGTELFANRPIADMLHEKTSSRVMQASAHALAAEPFSQLQVRRRLTEAATFDAPIVLDDVIRVTKEARVSASRFRAAISFTGDPDLFQAKGYGSARRKLKATIDGNNLVITATSFACDVAMVPYAIASEVIGIREMLAEQQDFILKHNRQAVKAWRCARCGHSRSDLFKTKSNAKGETYYWPTMLSSGTRALASAWMSLPSTRRG
jgi:hypothetical protein